MGGCNISGINSRPLPARLRAEIKAADTVGPVLLHIVTEKGRGYIPAETAQDKMHGVVKFDPKTGKQFKASAKAPSYTNAFAGNARRARPCSSLQFWFAPF